MPDNLLSIDDLKTVFNLIRDNPTSVSVSTAGLLLLFITTYITYKAVNSRPQDVKPWLKWLLFFSFFTGVAFSIAGPAISLLKISSTRLTGFERNLITPSQVLSNLKDNSRVTWLIRLIPYSPNDEPELAINRLTHLGRSDQRFTFVADYNELRGYTAREAVFKSGSSMENKSRVSAIIFPSNTIKIYPANARGLLQVIREINRNKDPNVTNYKVFNVDKELSQDEVDNLKHLNQITTWSWPSYERFYNKYCKLAQEFRCGEFSEKTLIGNISNDWHPLGFAKAISLQNQQDMDPCLNKEAVCNISNWEQATQLQSIVGVRVFLIENIEVSAINGRLLIDFNAPDSQVIPDIGISSER